MECSKSDSMGVFIWRYFFVVRSHLDDFVRLFVKLCGYHIHLLILSSICSSEEHQSLYLGKRHSSYGLGTASEAPSERDPARIQGKLSPRRKHVHSLPLKHHRPSITFMILEYLDWNFSYHEGASGLWTWSLWNKTTTYLKLNAGAPKTGVVNF